MKVRNSIDPFFQLTFMAIDDSPQEFPRILIDSYFFFVTLGKEIN